MTPGRLRQLAGAVGALVYPPCCLICDTDLSAAAGSRSLCESCFAAIVTDPHTTCPRSSSTIGTYTHLTDGCPRCRSQTFHFDSVIRLGPYEGRLREAI